MKLLQEKLLWETFAKILDSNKMNIKVTKESDDVVIK